MSDLNTKIKKGLSWTLTGQAVTQFVFVWFNIFLAKQLTPADYGLIGSITIFTNFAVIFVDFGFGSALIQSKNVTQDDLSTVFWFNIASGVLMCISLNLSAGLLADFFNNPALKPIAKLLSLNFIFSALISVQSIILNRKLNFKTRIIITWISTFLSYSLAIVLALMGYGVWALVIQSLVASFLTFVMLWYQSKWRPSFIFSVTSFKSLIKFGSSIVGTTLVGYGTRNADNLLVAKFLGSSSLGLYTRAYSLMMLPVSTVGQTISKVLFPAFSSIQDDMEKIKSIYLRITKTVAIISFPLMFGLCFLSEEFVLVFLGEKWIAMVPILQWLSILGSFQSILTLNGILYNSLGRAFEAFKITMIFNVILIAGFALGLYLYGLIGLTIAYFIIGTLGTLPILANIIKHINLSMFEMFKNLQRIFVSTLMMSAILYLSQIVLNIYLKNLLFRFSTEVVIGFSAYALSIYVLERKFIRDIFHQLKMGKR